MHYQVSQEHNICSDKMEAEEDDADRREGHVTTEAKT